MPSVVRIKNQRKSAKQKLTAYLQLTRLADPIYNILNDAFVFSLSLEVVSVYNLCAFADHRITNDLTSSKLRSQVLYLETKTTRYEIARYTDEGHKQIYRLSIVINPHVKDNNFYATAKIPLDDVQVLYSDL